MKLWQNKPKKQQPTLTHWNVHIFSQYEKNCVTPHKMKHNQEKNSYNRLEGRSDHVQFTLQTPRKICSAKNTCLSWAFAASFDGMYQSTQLSLDVLKCQWATRDKTQDTSIPLQSQFRTELLTTDLHTCAQLFPLLEERRGVSSNQDEQLIPKRQPS